MTTPPRVHGNTDQSGIGQSDVDRLGRVLSGSPEPLGVHWDGSGVNVAVAAPNADAVEICLFDARGRENRYRLPERDGGVWHGYLLGVGPGQRYGLRAYGPYAPERGLRYNPAKLLVDPYARMLTGALVPHPAIRGFDETDPYPTGSNGHDSVPFVPACVVIDGRHSPTGERPGIPWPETVIYELHVKGFTRTHPDVPPVQRGTYAGLAHPAVIEHLRTLGVTAVELLPVHAHVSEPALSQRGLSNYWGYNTVGFFAPHPGYAATDNPVAEFRAMVGALHAAGIEIILDVVFNHTAEGSERGPTLSLRGLDNTTYYRVEPSDPRRYRDVTGCGNTLNTSSPHVVKLIMDSLRYWVTEMGVDGYRFDLATALARNPDGFDPAAPLLAAIHADPLLSTVKLIAEPWDVGWGGYQVGAFPAPWAEWNGRYRDTVRAAWTYSASTVADLGYRITGSSDLYHHSGRRPWASVNFVTAHDGFTLADLVSYENKHNEANGEGNRDGDDHSNSTNCGVEGPSDDPDVLACRRLVRRALLATLLLSAGVPMLLAGDEFGRSQDGNNNAYCQDNATSWLHWPTRTTRTPDDRIPDDGVPTVGPAPSADPAGNDPMLLPLVSGLVALRRRSPALCRQTFFHGGPSSVGEPADITWFRTDGVVMSDTDWNSSLVRTVVAHLSGTTLGWYAPDGATVTGDSFLLVLHPDTRPVTIVLPGQPWASTYALLLDTSAEDLAGFPGTLDTPLRITHAGEELPVAGRAVLLLRVAG
ncbi:glycogen debranching protein GlgX [Candidatus Protofrankia californiensis]|uniref:glycogen debranching protein GlgX n=1 Tax=Candidatus Protofrankia californiensis TaxID=1839754 RepID=UPI003D349C82